MTQNDPPLKPANKNEFDAAAVSGAGAEPGKSKSHVIMTIGTLAAGAAMAVVAVLTGRRPPRPNP